MSVWAAIVWLGVLSVGQASADECAGLLSFGNVTDVIKTLFDCRPARGTLAPGESTTLEFGVMEKEGQFPDVLFTLAVVGGAGNVDLFCKPEERLGGRKREVVGPTTGVWSSNHTTGQDYVFISRDDPSYTIVTLTKGVRAAMFSCSGGSRSYAVHSLKYIPNGRLYIGAHS